MVLDSAVADAEVCGDILARVAGEDQFHDLALSRREARDAIRRILSVGDQVAQDLLSLDQLVVFTTQSRLSGESLSQPERCSVASYERELARQEIRAFQYGV